MKREDTIFGVFPVIEALRSEVNIDKLFIQKGKRSDKIESIVTTCENKGIQISYVPVEKLDRLVRANHQGIVALISPIGFHELETVVSTAESADSTPLFLILDQISDVRNFGAILRTAECTGVSAVIVQKKGGAPVSGDTVKTSAGAIFKVPICKVDHIKDAIYFLQSSGVKVVVATEKSSQSLYNLNLNEPLAIVMGSEGKGVSRSVYSIADAQASLPLLGEVNSLNVSVACGVFLYEVVRQRNF